MHGPAILVRSLNRPSTPDKYGNVWRYHSRSDRHSKVGCWGILFDLLQVCPLLRDHAERGSVVFGINHEMVDFKQNRKKNLDLVICTPGSEPSKADSFAGLIEHYKVELDATEKRLLRDLPDVKQAKVGTVHLALEAKACMTAHVRALPRLYDELNSSHATIHGSSDMAIAAGLVMVNIADSFVSSDMNKHDLKRLPANVSPHKQPQDAIRTIDKAKEIPRRAKTGEDGFDALAIVVVDCKNDASAVKLYTKQPAPPPNDIFEYESMIRRVAHLYESRFPRA